MPALHPARDPRAWAATAAIAAPTLLAFNVAPSPTFLNQALSLGLWGVLLLMGPAAPAASPLPTPRAAPAAWALMGAFAAMALGVLWSWPLGGLPSDLGLSALGLLAAGALVAWSGLRARNAGSSATASSAGSATVATVTKVSTFNTEPGQWFAAFAWAWLITGALNGAIAAVQVFAPQWTDGAWIATSGIPGRAVGNLRQPNHLASVLAFSAVAAVALAELGMVARRWAVAAAAFFVFGIVLTASRTGLASVLLLALWGALDRRLARPSRALLLALPVVYALSWLGVAEWAKLSQHAFGGAQRLAESDISSSRFGIWANTWALIRQHPWAGVGFGEFNLAWTLTPFPTRPTAFFDHTHNLPLQLAVELGLPLAVLVMGLLLWALIGAALQAWGRGAAADDSAQLGARAGFVMLLMVGLHSLLEYPLWYAYFLLPTAWIFGFAVGRPAEAAPRRPATAPAPRPIDGLAWGALALVMGAALSVLDYTRVVVIFSADGALPLHVRIARGQHSVLFSHHADYAAVTSGDTPRDAGRAFVNTAHYLLDARLMMAWSTWLAETGHPDLAAHLAARLREFRKPDADEFFQACPQVRSGAPRALMSAASAALVASAPASGATSAASSGASGASAVPAQSPASSAAAAFPCAAPARTPRWNEFLQVR